MRCLLIIVLLVAVILSAGCVGENKNFLVTPTPQIVYITVFVTPTPIPRETFTQMQNSNKEKICDEKYPGNTYNSTTDKCERDNTKYCAIYFPGSIPDPLTNTCRYPTPSTIPTPTLTPTKKSGFTITGITPDSMTISGIPGSTSVELKINLRPYSVRPKNVQLIRNQFGHEVIYARDFRKEFPNDCCADDVQITSWFTIPSGSQGNWHVVVVAYDGSSSILENAFAIM